MQWPPPSPAQPRDTGTLKQEELRGSYKVYHSTPPHALVDALWQQSQDLLPKGRFSVDPLPHAVTSV